MKAETTTSLITREYTLNYYVFGSKYVVASNTSIAAHRYINQALDHTTFDQKDAVKLQPPVIVKINMYDQEGNPLRIDLETIALNKIIEKGSTIPFLVTIL